MNQRVKQSLKILLPLIVLAVCTAAAFKITQNPSQARKARPPEQALLNVEAIQLARSQYTIQLKAYGEVRPRTEGSLVSQVSGTLTQVSPRFQNGGFFEAGETLVHIDDRDYKAAVIMAESDLVQAQFELEEERARGTQAEANWKRIGRGKAASELVLRKPQLAAAKARVASARASLDKAKLDLQRTKISAPYAGRIVDKKVDVGQFVSTNTELADIYAVDYVEVRLPLSPRQVEHLTIPEQYRGEEAATRKGPDVEIIARQGRKQFSWKGFISRAESALDSNNRQLYVIAQINDPYRQREDGAPPLKIGQFIEASIKARTLDDVFTIPRDALYQGKTVVLVENGQLVRRDVEIIWSDETNAVVNSQLNEGEWLVTTPLGNPVSGTRVKIRSQ
ncbi:efflux RND transporter periplasmic adaptor subunit [Alkalimarinus coralli]|uniref:efflux RND transporter periplasmic adaptor subunit n=1 Tax=Alkalimarinus coralli TaxID=2935863 RepID=UPI00202AE2A3|nr:efflux RND transporter periplasmic adaptor subunit [Alkalimarinus coralli]